MSEKTTVSVWGYRQNADEPNGVESRMFELAPDAKLPDGWCDSPSKCVAPTKPAEKSKK